MATPYSFQSLNFNNIPGREIEANRRYTAGLEGMFKSIGEGAKNISESYMTEEERKKREAEDKKKWDNMIAQQEYQKEQARLNKEYQASRDAIADAHYNNEWNVKQEERRLEAGKRMNEHAALENYRKGLKNSYTPEFLEKYGPTAQAEFEAALAAPTLAEAMASGSRLGQIKYQQDMLDFQREQNAANEKRDSWMREADELVASVDDMAARNGIDLNRNAVLPKDRAKLKSLRAELEGLRDYLNTAQRHSVNSAARVGAINAQIDEINRKLGYKPPPRTWEPKKQ